MEGQQQEPAVEGVDEYEDPVQHMDDVDEEDHGMDAAGAEPHAIPTVGAPIAIDATALAQALAQAMRPLRRAFSPIIMFHIY